MLAEHSGTQKPIWRLCRSRPHTHEPAINPFQGFSFSGVKLYRHQPVINSSRDLACLVPVFWQNQEVIPEAFFWIMALEATEVELNNHEPTIKSVLGWCRPSCLGSEQVTLLGTSDIVAWGLQGRLLVQEP